MQLFMTRLRRLGPGPFQLLQSVGIRKQFANIPIRKSSRSDYSNEMRQWVGGVGRSG